MPANLHSGPIKRLQSQQLIKLVCRKRRVKPLQWGGFQELSQVCNLGPGELKPWKLSKQLVWTLFFLSANLPTWGFWRGGEGSFLPEEAAVDQGMISLSQLYNPLWNENDQLHLCRSWRRRWSSTSRRRRGSWLQRWEEKPDAKNPVFQILFKYLNVF